jgi:hypothetical protein
MTVVELLIFAVPFLLSLLGQGSMAKMLCLVMSLLAMLLSVAPGAACAPWSIGMLIAAISVWERIRLRRAA